MIFFLFAEMIYKPNGGGESGSSLAPIPVILFHSISLLYFCMLIFLVQLSQFLSIWHVEH